MIRFMKAAAAAALLVSGLAPMTAPAASAQASSLLDYDSIEIPVADREGMVVSQNEIASYVGARVLEQGGQGPDHPVHPLIPETEYLKSVFCRRLSPAAI